MTDAEYREATARVKLFARTFEREPPTRLVDDEGCVAGEMMMFCRDNGMSLDWEFEGDLRHMVLASFRAKQYA